MKRLLLDTHVFIWWRTENRRLGKAARRAITHADVVLVSVASAWEFAIKMGTGKLRLDGSFADGVRDSDFEELPVTMAHAERVALLPDVHRDPFDRMLIAQSFVEGLTIVTGDEVFARYGAAVLEV